MAFKAAFKATKDVLALKCFRCSSTVPPTQWFITCVDGCCSCDQCPESLGNLEFWYKTKKGGVIGCTNRSCQAEALAKPVPNKSYAAAKGVLEEVDTALKHGVSLIKEQGYVTSAMEEGEAAPEWVPIPPKQAMFKAKAEIASAVMKMKSEGKSAKAIQAFICGEEADEEEEEGEEGGEEETDEPASKRARKEPTAEQLERREARKEANRKKKAEDKRCLNEYPALKKKCERMSDTIRDARRELLTEKDPDYVNSLLGEESDEENEDEGSDDGSEMGVGAVESDGE